MPNRRRRRIPRLVLSGAVAVVLAGCSSNIATQSASPPVSRPSASSAPPPATPTSTASPASAPPTPSPSATTAATAATAGRPYDARSLLQAMADSHRPGGVPQQVQTAPIADQMAQAIWTYEGKPWPAIAVSGSCGPESCTIDVSGTPDGGAGEDLYTFDVRPAAGTATVLLADLHGYPSELNAALDAIARDGVPGDRLAGLQLVSARWVPPPDDGQYVLSYRSGGEEGSPALDVAVDLPSRTVLDVRRPG